jgi:hypothetical protein
MSLSQLSVAGAMSPSVGSVPNGRSLTKKEKSGFPVKDWTYRNVKGTGVRVSEEEPLWRSIQDDPYSRHRDVTSTSASNRKS